MTDPARTRDPERREKILAAAADLLARRGFAGVSMNDIGEEVGVSGAAIYRHFASKSALLVEVFDRSIDGLLADEREIRAEPIGPLEALTRLVARQVDFVVDEGDFARVYHHEVDSLPTVDRARLRGKQRRYLDDWVQLLREIHPGLAEALARTRVHAAIGAVQSPLFHAVRIPRADLKPELVRTALAALGLSDPPIEN